MKYLEKVLGDSAEEHAKLLAKQKKEGGAGWSRLVRLVELLSVDGWFI